MGKSIAVMNTKGGVGKSTIVMAIAETLSVYHGKNVLVVDSDSQTSISTMLIDMARWEQLERDQATIVHYLEAIVLDETPTDWKPFVATGASDVDDAESVYLLPSHMQLSLFEREVSATKREPLLREAVRNFLADASRYFDLIIVDCPPGLSVLTECWLRECDYFLPPTKPDYLAVRGLSVLKAFREQSVEQGFSELIGVLVNLKDGRVGSEDVWHERLAADPANRVFQTAVPRRAYIQRAAEFDPETRTFIAKYPGDAGHSVRQVTEELLARLEGGSFVAREREEWRPLQASTTQVARPEPARPLAAKAEPAKAPAARPAQQAATNHKDARSDALDEPMMLSDPVVAAPPKPAASVPAAPNSTSSNASSSSAAAAASKAVAARPDKPKPADAPAMAAVDDDEPFDLGSLGDFAGKGDLGEPMTLDQPMPLDLPASAMSTSAQSAAQSAVKAASKAGPDANAAGAPPQAAAGNRVIHARQIIKPKETAKPGAGATSAQAPASAPASGSRPSAAGSGNGAAGPAAMKASSDKD